MTKIYLVSSGTYSDYRVEGIFSTREKAENFAGLFPQDDYDCREIEEYEVDASFDIPPGMKAWDVYMNAAGEATVKQCSPHCRDSGKVFKGEAYRSTSTTCFARDEKHAIKIASERRAIAIANGLFG